MADTPTYGEQSKGPVTYHVEEQGAAGNDKGPTMIQKVKARVLDAENHLKGKKSTSSDGGTGYSGDVDEGQQHGGAPSSLTGTGATTQFSGEGADEATAMEKIKGKVRGAGNYVKGKQASEIEDPHPELAYIPPAPQDTEPGLLSRIKGGVHGKGAKGGETVDSSAVPSEADKGVSPEVTNMHEAVNGVGSSEVGTGYEEDTEEPMGRVPSAEWSS